MSTTKTATVEVLTAEVRVLMVGSRQVTLSVFRQLDFVQYDKCDPFGRVNDDVRNYNNDGYIVGKEKETGILVRAAFPYRKRPAWSNKDESDLRDELRSVKCYQNKDLAYATPEWQESQLKNHQELAYYLQEQKDEMPKKQAAYDEAKAIFNALPLIVLAGLK